MIPKELSDEAMFERLHHKSQYQKFEKHLDVLESF